MSVKSTQASSSKTKLAKTTKAVSRVSKGGALDQLKKQPVLVVTGEHSGDLLGGDVVRSLQKQGFSKFLGTGGPYMKEAGVVLTEEVDNMAVIGIVEALKAYPRLKKLARGLAAMAAEQGVKFAILIDYPGFNLRLAEMLQEKGIRVIYLVSPQIWAWHYSRIKTIRKYVNLMLTLFPFEKEIYEKEGVRSECVGHFMVDRIPPQLKLQPPLKVKATRKAVGLLPGSRGSEISRLLPLLLESAQIMFEENSRLQFFVPGINPRYEEFIKEKIAEYEDLPVEFIPGGSLRVMEVSELVLLSSGTATLETAWFMKPMVIVYKMGWINYFVASMVSRSRYIGIPNILGRRQVAQELLQNEAMPENVAAEGLRILNDSEYREGIVKELEFVRKQMGRGNPAQKAAKFIVEYLSES